MARDPSSHQFPRCPPSTPKCPHLAAAHARTMGALPIAPMSLFASPLPLLTHGIRATLPTVQIDSLRPHSHHSAIQTIARVALTYHIQSLLISLLLPPSTPLYSFPTHTDNRRTRPWPGREAHTPRCLHLSLHTLSPPHHSSPPLPPARTRPLTLPHSGPPHYGVPVPPPSTSPGIPTRPPPFRSNPPRPNRSLFPPPFLPTPPYPCR